MSKFSIKTSLITAIAFALISAVFQLQAAEEKTTNYKDWGYRCQTPKGFDKKVCFIFQRVSNKENNAKIADITVAYAPNGDKPIMVVTLPLGVFLPAGIQIKIDDQKEEIARAPYVTCFNDGCQARVPLNDKLSGLMKKGSQLKVAFLTPQQKQLAFPISLSGFTAAINSLKK